MKTLHIVFRFVGRNGEVIYRAYPIDSPIMEMGLFDSSGGRTVLCGLRRSFPGQSDIYTTMLTDEEGWNINDGRIVPPRPKGRGA